MIELGAFLLFQGLLAAFGRFFHFWLAVDQFLNVVIGSGWADEAYSAYCHRTSKWTKPIVNGIFFWQEDHCAEAFYSELKRRHLPPEYRV